MPANYVLLQRIELNDSAASVTFSNIPQSGYTDLKIVWSLRQSTGPNNDIYISFNGSTSSFSSRSVEGAGSATNSGTVARYLGTVTNTTANTFASGEVYIPNYTSSNNKSFSSDNVGEANATQAYATLAAGLWSNTAAINSVTITPGAGNWVQYSTFSLYGLAAVGTTPVIAPKATGGNITSDGTYWIHTFNSTGTFTPLQGLSCDYLVVAGGGGAAGGDGNGGGGAGGLRSTVTATGGGGVLESKLSVGVQSYTVTVGAGGSSTTVTNATKGNDSTFSTITSNGGGASPPNAVGSNNTNGGSGAGCTYTSGYAYTTGVGTANQGYNGGNGAFPGGSYSMGGGGGGAGAVGASATTSGFGNGGNGVAVSITGSSVTYAGGGGGGTDYRQAGGLNAGTGGAGGGGAGGVGGGAGANATANTGGGGGGGGYNGSFNKGGNGGSGIVIIRYPIA